MVTRGRPSRSAKRFSRQRPVLPAWSVVRRFGVQADRRVSGVIPARNRARCLPATRQGLRQQTHRDFEVVVVAVPSTEDTDNVLARIKHLRVEALPETEVGLARNIGVAAAAGDILAFIPTLPRSG